MTDLIDRQSLLESLSVNYKEGKKLIENGEVHLDNFAEGYLECSELIRLAPTVEPKKGEWEDKILETDHKAWVGRYECSECKTRINQSWYNYCPGCGADMRGDNPNE